MKVGYARVSTSGQSLETQIAALKAEGCERIFAEKESGKSTQRRHELDKAIAKLQDGDVLVVCKLDRLARSMNDLGKIAERIKAEGGDLKILNTSIDTTTPTGKLLFNVLGSIAEFERDLILERTADGRAAAKAAGKHMGRRATLTEAQQAALRAEWAVWTGSATELAQKYGIGRATLYRLVGRPAGTVPQEAAR